MQLGLGERRFIQVRGSYDGMRGEGDGGGGQDEGRHLG